MNIVRELVDRGIATSDWHAAGMLNVLECGKLATDEERLARCKLYKLLKLAGVPKAEARRLAIKGEQPPMLAMPEEVGK